MSKGVFPDNVKVASISPADKQSNDKNKASNFRLVSVITFFSEIYESVIKTQLVSVSNKIFLPYIAA